MPNALKKPFVNRQTFNPENPVHIESFKYFVQTGNWGDVQFFAELPYNEVPMTCMMKYCEHQLGVQREAQADRSKRIAQRPNLVVVPIMTTAEQVAQREKELEHSNSLILKREKA